MGSLCDVSIDGFSFWGSKSYVDDETLSIFYESDRETRRMPRPQYAGHEDEDVIVYAAGATAMGERLDAMGFTSAHAREDYRRGQSEDYDIYLSHGFTRDDRRQVKAWTYDRWCEAIARLVPRGFQVWCSEAFTDDPDAERISDDLASGLGSCFSDMRHMLRGLLDALPNAKEVVLDVTDLISAGYYAQDEAICAEARRGWAHQHSLYGSILLLTEGKSDTRILRETFSRMAPHLVGLYGFLDFEGLKIEGSAHMLPKTVRSFIGAGVAQRMIAIFDNDTAGVAAMTSLSAVPLPDHVRLMALPHNTAATAYPTIGPQGVVAMDVNGLACAIEMYLGVETLRAPNGEPLRVRWGGYDQKMGRYQGIVEDKDGIAERYLQRLRACATPSEARMTFPEMAEIIDAITAQFSGIEPRLREPRERLSG